MPKYLNNTTNKPKIKNELIIPNVIFKEESLISFFFFSISDENESIFIAPKSRHRLSNPTNDNLILIEVQRGTYFGEDDIIRFDDKYGRIS